MARCMCEVLSVKTGGSVYLPCAHDCPCRHLYQECISVFALVMIVPHFICLSKSCETLLCCLFILYGK